MKKARFLFLGGMVLAAALARIVPHAPNFTPVAALALFGGVSFDNKRMALLVPLAGLFLSDLVLGFYAVTPVVYASFALIAGLGIWVRSRQSLGLLALATIAGAVLFFGLTNLGVWALGGWYPKNWAGLVDCYLAGIPFFRNTLLSDLLYSATLFGGLALAEKRWPVLAETQNAA